MNAADLLRDLEDRGVSVFLRGGEVAHAAPDGLDWDVPARIAPLRQEIRTLLENRNAPEERALSPMEEAIWLMEQANPEVDYAIRTHLTVTGPLDAGRLRVALLAVVTRHRALRSVFANIEGRLVCHALPQASIDFGVVDLTDLSKRAQAAAAEELQALLLRQRIDLAAGPPIKVRVIQRAADDFSVWVIVHHIVFDEGSNAVFCDELIAFYEGRTPVARPASYSEYLRWLAGERSDEHVAFWRELLADAPVSELATIRPGDPADAAQAPVHETRAYAGERAQRLLQACKRYQCTPFVLLLGVMQLWLSRYSGACRGVIGVPMSLRPDDDGALIGLCLNTLAIPYEIDDAMPFSAFLARLRRNIAEILEHRTLPFQEAVAQTETSRDSELSVLLRHVFSYRTEASSIHSAADGLLITPEALRFPEHGIAISFVATRRAEGFEFTLGGNASVLKTAGAAALLAQYMHVLDTAISADAAPLRTLKLRGPQRGTGTEPPGKASSSVSARFLTAAARTPNRIAVFDDTAVTYETLATRVDTVAAALADHGIRAGDVIAMDLPADAWRVACQLAALRVGAGFVPMREDWPASMRARVVETCRLLVTHARREEDGACGEVVTLDALRNAPPRRSSTRSSTTPSEAVAFIIYTSGSTGEPKPVQLTHRALDLLIEWSCAWFDPPPSAVIAAGTSPSFDMSIFETVLPFAAGCACLMLRDPLALLESPYRDRVTWLNGVPSVVREVVMDARRPKFLSHVTLGGETIPLELLRALRTAYGNPRIDNLYGPSEVTICALAQRLDDPQHDEMPPVGKALPTHRVRIVDPDLNEQPPYAIGEFVFSGPCISPGYVRGARETAAGFMPDPFSGREGDRLYASGDLGFMTPEGTFYILGRRDAQTKLRGMRIELGGIETVLRSCPGVADAACAIVGQATAGAWLGALLVAEDSLDVGHVRSTLAESLPAWQLPSKLVVCPSLPRTVSGKMDRAAVASRLRSLAGSSGGVVRAAGAGEEAVVMNVWKEILGHEVNDVDANFFDVGGTSLLVPRLHAALSSLCDGLQMSELFTNGTARQQALIIRKRGQTETRVLGNP